MNILVFGATGYIGSHIARHLSQQGHRVSGFVRDAGSRDSVSQLGAIPVVGDLDDPADLPRLLADQQVVIWAAQLMLEDELRITRQMLELLDDGSDRCFLLTSGTSLMSIPTNGYWDERNYAEDDIFEPRRQIAPRLEIEAMVRRAGIGKLRTMVIRPPLVWGNGGCRIIADFYHSARQTGDVCHIGPGLNVYSNVHVDDLAELYRLAIERGRQGGLYFAVSGETSFGVMARAIADALQVKTRAIDIEEGMQIWDRFMARIVLCSCSRQRSPRARDELGWKPAIDRLDILGECRNPAYRQADERRLPSWVRPHGDINRAK